jgi:hypothetical protein
MDVSLAGWRLVVEGSDVCFDFPDKTMLASRGHITVGRPVEK